MSYQTAENEQSEWESSAGTGVLSETEEMEYAANLLEITDEQELDQFLGNLFKKVSRAAGSVIKSPIGQALGGLAKGAIKHVLPTVGGAIGGVIPGVGSALGSKAAEAAGRAFGLELEGLSHEDQEFETAKRVVRLLGSAAEQAARGRPGSEPESIARRALTEAARQHAPGLIRRSGARAQSGNIGPDDQPFNEAQETEYASQLMEVTSEEELDQFLGDIFKKAARGAETLLKSPTGQAVRGYVKQAIKTALPKVGGALGERIASGAGRDLGSQLGSAAGDWLGLETSESNEDEFGTAQRMVRLAGSAARHATSSRRQQFPYRAARSAFHRAARRHAPELFRGTYIRPEYVTPVEVRGCGCGAHNEGDWVREGGKLILLDV